MLPSGTKLWNPVTKTRVVIVRTAAESGGRELIVDWVVAPGERMVAAAHLHPGPGGVVAERFELLAGTAGYRVGRRKGLGSAPHVWEIPCNIAHVHPWNAGDNTMHVRQTISLAEPDTKLLGGVQDFFETLVALSQQGRADRKGNIRGQLQNSLSLYELLLPGTYLAGVPRRLQEVVLGALATLARRRGLSAYVAPRPPSQS